MSKMFLIYDVMVESYCMEHKCGGVFDDVGVRETQLKRMYGHDVYACIFTIFFILYNQQCTNFFWTDLRSAYKSWIVSLNLTFL